MSASPDKIDPTKPLLFKVLGRTLEHFGVQMYKRREVAIAELVANCWDAGATEVFVEIPAENDYNPNTGIFTIRDTGCGMDVNAVQQNYLVLGRNRRREKGAETQTVLPLDFGSEVHEDVEADENNQTRQPHAKTRRVMGRKGIGKLAGFGLAQKMTVTTWTAAEGVEFSLDLKELKLDDGVADDIEIQWSAILPKSEYSKSGTIVKLEILKHKSPLVAETLAKSLARRFSRFVKGQMAIRVNGAPLPDPTPMLDQRFPTDEDSHLSATLPSGAVIRYWYGFAHDVIHERELRGFAILVNGKVAQSPPFFFDVEAKASGQHSTRYVIGEIEADFIDLGTDDETDLVSTDRQELDWDAEELRELKTWGEALSHKVLSSCRDFRGDKTVREVMSNPQLESRIKRLDKPSQKEIRKFLIILGNRDNDDGKTVELAGALVRAYEFRQFHDVIAELENAAKDPNELAVILQQMNEWKVLESRAILEVLKGRLDIIDKFERMLCNDAPETASAANPENMHDLLAGNPWLLNPEWQIFAEEKRITTQLREWGEKEMPDFKGRYDFLALGTEAELVIIEIKRPDYAAEISEIHRLSEYADRLSLGHADRLFRKVFICGRTPKVAAQSLEDLKRTPNFEIRFWHELFKRTRSIYEHYRAVLEGSVDEPSFLAKEREIARTRQLLDAGMHRPPEIRAEGIPPAD